MAKKRTFFILLIIGSLFLCACGGSSHAKGRLKFPGSCRGMCDEQSENYGFGYL